MTGADGFSPAERRGLRSAALDVKARCPRGRFAIRIGAGLPGGHAHWFEIRVGDRLDHTLRTEIAGALVLRVRPRVATPWLWITRPGPLSVTDADLALVVGEPRGTGRGGPADALRGGHPARLAGAHDRRRPRLGPAPGAVVSRAHCQVCTGSLVCMRSRYSSRVARSAS